MEDEGVLLKRIRSGYMDVYDIYDKYQFIHTAPDIHIRLCCDRDNHRLMQLLLHRNELSLLTLLAKILILNDL